MAIIKISIVVLVGCFIAGCFRSGSGDNQGQRSTISEAEKTLEYSFVKSATNVWLYENIGGLQSLDRYVRFEVLKTDITNQINMMTMGNNNTLKRKLSYKIKQFNVSEIRKPHNSKTKLPWWNPESITNGICVEEDEAYALHIWIDCSNGRFYVQQSD